MKQAKAASAATDATQDSSGANTSGRRSNPSGTAAGVSSKAKFSAGQKLSPAETKKDAIDFLKADHRKVEGLFDEYENADGAETKAGLAKQICMELIIHTKIEEELFYPACRAAHVEDSALDEAQVEHDGAKVMIADLIGGSPSDDYYDAKVKVLSDYIKHHVNEEEKPRSGIFAKAKAAKVDTSALGERMQARKGQLTAQKEALSTSPLEARSLHLQDIHTTQENAQMTRNSNYGNRDSHGRLTHGEDYGSGGRGYSSRGDGQDYGQNRDRNMGGYGARDMSSRQSGMSQDHDRLALDRQGHDHQDHDRTVGTYGNALRSRDDETRYMGNRGNQDHGSYQEQLRNQDWDDDAMSDRNRQSRSGTSPGYRSGAHDQDEDRSHGSYMQGRNQGGQYDRHEQSDQYSQSNFDQNRGQGYDQNNRGRYGQSSFGQDDFGARGQYGEGQDFNSSRGHQQSQSRSQGRNQQTSQNRFAQDGESHDRGYGSYDSSSSLRDRNYSSQTGRRYRSDR